MNEGVAGLLAGARPRFAGLPADFDAAPIHHRTTARGVRNRKRLRFPRLGARTRRGGLGVVLAAVLFGATGYYGSVLGGQYSDFVKVNGSPADLVAKLVGFPINAVTISGIKELNQREILAAAAIDPNHSLLFLNAADVRDRLKAMPLVQDAVVTKLFPDRLVIAINERDPVAIWQIDGRLSIVSADGVVIDSVRDDRFSGLPFVVGDGAEKKVGEFLALLNAAGDMRGRIVAGILVGDRRWTLKMDSGIEVKLPETDAAAAIARLAQLDQQSKVLDKDLISIDLRMPSRLSVRLSDDAAAARADQLAKKPKKGAAL